MQPKAIFFDFDGVLLDTVEAKGRAISKAFAKYGNETIEKVYQYHLNNGGMNRIAKVQTCYRMFLGREIEESELAAALEAIAFEMNRELLACEPVKGALDFMKEYRASGGLSWIVSAAPEAEIQKLSLHFGYAQHVKAIFGFPNKKSEVIARLIAEENLQPQSCLMIGDAKEDYHAAEVNNTKFLLRKTPFSSFSFGYEGNSIDDFINAKKAIQLV